MLLKRRSICIKFGCILVAFDFLLEVEFQILWFWIIGKMEFWNKYRYFELEKDNDLNFRYYNRLQTLPALQHSIIGCFESHTSSFIHGFLFHFLFFMSWVMIWYLHWKLLHDDRCVKVGSHAFCERFLFILFLIWNSARYHRRMYILQYAIHYFYMYFFTHFITVTCVCLFAHMLFVCTMTGV